MTHQTTVYLVDDDAGDRHYLAFRLGAMGIEAWPFAGADSFLANLDGLRPQLLLFAMEAPPHWGAEMVGYLQRRQIDWPMIALSRSRDVGLAVDTMKMGVLDFLSKPVDEEKLVAAIRSGSGLLSERLEASQLKRSAEARVSSLTAREVSICKALLAGQPNKVIAHNLGISIRTVEAHRSNIMMKLSVRSIAEVFLLLTQAGLSPDPVQAPTPLQRRLPLLTPMLRRDEKRDMPAAA
ncbi:MAG TPA: LuxR C-terminal-related transcriptional regulator [Allosphingosinicella sp.]|jgi:two-component system response regulator FixJ